jgi:hypothetical protein
VEALVRWLHPTLSIVPPLQLIPFAKDMGIICDIGGRVLRETCRQMVAWDAQGNLYSRPLPAAELLARGGEFSGRAPESLSGRRKGVLDVRGRRLGALRIGGGRRGLPRRDRRDLADRVDRDCLEVRGTDDLQVFHVRRIVEQVVPDARALMHGISGRHQRFLVLVHEARPALQHDHDVEIRLMTVPAGALFRRNVRADKLREHAASGRIGDAEVLVLEEIPQAVVDEIRVLWTNV